MRRQRVLGAVVLALSIAALCVAHAARSDDSIRIRVAYSVARGCPSRARFMEEIRARSARVVEAAAGEEAIDVAVSVSRDASGFAGRVTLGAADAGQTTRSIAGASCAEVVGGLALVTAVAVDPAALSAPDAAPTVDTADAGADDASDAAEAATDTGEGDAIAVVQIAPDASSMRAPPSEPPHWQLSLGIAGTLVAAPAPGTLWSGAAFVDLARTEPGWAPSFRLRVERSFHDEMSTTTPGADFVWTAATADACPTAWLPYPLRLEACARVSAGALDVTGTNASPSRQSTRVWASAGPLARVRWTMARLSLDAEAAAVVPFVRDRYFAEPNVTIYNAPVLGWSVGAGIGWAIW